MRKQALCHCRIISCRHEKLRELSRQSGKESGEPAGTVSGKNLPVSAHNVRNLLFNSNT